MAEERAMAAAEGLQVRRLSDELGMLREEAVELKRMLEAAAEMGEGFKMATSVRMLNAAAAQLIAERLIYPGAPAWATQAISSAAMASYMFLEARTSRSNRRLFVQRRSELAGRVSDLRRRLDGLGTGLEAADQLRGFIDGFPDVGGSWSQLFYKAWQVLLMVGGHVFLLALVRNLF